MKKVTVEISDARAAAVEAAVRSGEFESAAQVVDAALAVLLGHDNSPDLDQLQRDIDEIEERERQGETAMSATEALRSILAELPMGGERARRGRPRRRAWR
jgi:Arc/MetJ-type ribon-helix-helix transcriptional regulator